MRGTRPVVVAWRHARGRYGWLGHLARAKARYDEADGGRLAAAVTYYAFFATFALGLLGFAAFGFVLDDPAVQRSVQHYLDQNLPSLNVQSLRTARSTIGVIAFLGLPVTGWFWVDALRSSVRKVWRLPEYPGAFVIRLLIDLLVLVGLGLLFTASLATTFVTTGLAGWLADAATDPAEARWLVADRHRHHRRGHRPADRPGHHDPHHSATRPGAVTHIPPEGPGPPGAALRRRWDGFVSALIGNHRGIRPL